MSGDRIVKLIVEGGRKKSPDSLARKQQRFTSTYPGSSCDSGDCAAEAFEVDACLAREAGFDERLNAAADVKIAGGAAVLAATIAPARRKATLLLDAMLKNVQF